MKKSLIALAVLAASGAASAQSSVTLFGGGDVGYKSVKSGDNKFNGLGTDGIYSSRLGFRGTEDLGGGMSALFHFEGGMQPDDGTNAKFDFRRKSVIGLAGGFGEVRVGRDYTLVFTVLGNDPFGTNGVGSAGNLLFSTVVDGSGPAPVNAGTFFAVNNASTNATNPAAVTAKYYTVSDPNAVRSNNAISYYSPNFSGVQVSGSIGFGQENAGGIGKKQGALTAFKVSYDQGPISAALALQTTKGGDNGVVTPAVTATDDQKWATTVLGGSYNLGMAKLHFINQTNKWTVAGDSIKITNRVFGVSAPFGATTVRASYITKKGDGDSLGNQFALGAVHDLSKRTAVYATYSSLKNKNGAANNVGTPVSAADSTSKGFETGVKVTF